MSAATYRVDDATAPIWLGSVPSGWGDALHAVRPGADGRDAASVLAACGLAWRVEQRPVEAVLGDGPEAARARVPRVLANVRSDTGTVLGIVGAGYRPLQNADGFALADAIVDSGEAHWLGAGATRGGARVHAVMRLDREIRIGGADGEDVLPLLVLRNGHDGGLALTVSVAPFRLVCLNGMLLPVPGATRTWRTRHTAQIGERLGDARRTLGIAWRYFDALEAIGERLLAAPIGERDFERFLAALVPDPPDAAPTDRRRRNAATSREQIRDVYLTTPDLADLRGTRWGALQAVTAWHDHHARTRTTRNRRPGDARFERATAPAPIKDRALALLDR